MAPTPQSFIVDSSSPTPDSLTGNEIVITGISGLFPKSDNVVQFMENLYNHVDMVEPNRPPMSFKHPDMPKFMGKINEYYKFDNQFFRVPFRQIKLMEPYNRKLLEEAYSAIFDAGVNPASISGGKIGVFIGSSFNDQSTGMYLYNENIRSPYNITGCNKAMLANRISYWIDSQAMSYTIDAGTASSTASLTQAYWAIRNGMCDAAIVGGCNHCINPMLSVNMRRVGILTLDGKTKCFDKNGDGYVRSEACGTIFLQKAKDAKRIYCEVYYAKEKFCTSPGGAISVIHQPEDLEKFLHEFYNDIDVSPDMVDYIEANAIGIAEADSKELEAIANFFAKNKTIKIGSVKSNMGHGEAASGICSLIKICLANHNGILPANLHYYEPPDNITALKDGRIQVVTKNHPLNRSYVGLNSFGFGGLNIHVLLKNIYKPKDKTKYISSIPRLVLASARTESGVNKIINYLKNKPIDPEEIALLHNFYSTDVSGHAAKGYVILDTDENDKTITSSESTQLYNGAKRPVWFLYSGMGSQWATMGATLMRMPIFAAAVQRCCKVLGPKGIDVIRILTEPDETIFDNVINSFVGIAVTQIALTDVLKELEIVPDNVIGHSVGELGCAYALGCLTAEEMILAGYYRGLVSVEVEMPKGTMAAVGLGYKDILPICPPEIDIACHNSSKSCTISGPCEAVKKFIAELKTRKVFVKELKTSNIAYHSRYVAKLGDVFRSKLEDIFPTNKLRTEKWLSTSILPQNWDKPEAQYCSAEYFNNNLLGAVYFEEVATMIPSNAIVIEIAPHGLLQSIVKSSHEGCIHVPLTKRNHHDSLGFLLDAIGKLYEAGLNPKIDALYPRVTFPVSTGTPILSHLVEWEHSEDWLKSAGMYNNITPSREVKLSIYDDDWSFMKEHTREGFPVVPEAAILFLVWEELGNCHGVEYNKLSVGFTDVEFHGTINYLQEDAININVNIMKESGKFEVKWKDVIIIATGYIQTYDESYLHDYVHISETEDTDMQLNSKDVYTIMNLRGHSYGSKMQSINSCNFKRSKAQINWNGDWIMLLDALLQLGALATDYTDVVIPVYINQLFIDTLRHEALLNKGKYNAVLMGSDEKIIRCGAVEMKNIVFQRKPRTNDECIVSQKIINDPDSLYYENNATQQMKLISTGCGNFDKLYWIPYNDIKCSSPVQVSYAGVSIRDCYKVMGSIPECDSFGMDYSGINERNERVMGVVSSGAMATSVEADLDLLWPVPEHWSLEDAATVPMPYLLVYYALTIRCEINKNHSVLILDGATALGQAFISVCLDIDCNVFTTVSNFANKKLLLKNFPKLKEENTIDCSIKDIKSALGINGKRSLCDCVVNCGGEASIEHYFQCVARLGCLLDIIDVPEYKLIGMNNLTPEKNFILVYLPNLFRPKHLEERKLLQARITEGIARGIVKPLNRVVYSPTEVSKAFRLFASNGSKSRVLLNMMNVEIPRIALSTITHSNGTQIVISDETDLGIEVVDRLINEGAKYVVLHCKIRSGYLQYKLHSWNNSGASVSIYSDDLLDENSCNAFFEKSKSNGAVHGIFIIENVMKQKYEHFNKINNGKDDSDEPVVSIIHNVNEVSSKLCPELRSFVVIAFTSPDETNERILLKSKNICQLRRQRGMSAIIFEIRLKGEQAENIGNFLINTNCKNLSTMFMSLESAIENNQDVTFTMTNQPLSTNFEQKLLKILGIPNVHTCKENIALGKFGLNNLLFEEIKALIYTMYGINYPVKYIQQMTIQNLLTLGDDSKPEVKTGLDALFSYVDPDEIRASEPIMLMPSCNDYNGTENIQLDPSATYLFMMPGFEGHYEVFTSMCRRLKIEAVAFQTGLEFQEDNISEMTQRIFNNIKEKFQLKTKFYLLGFSFGVNLALELASLIEKEGHTGLVYCLASSPDMLKLQIEEYMGNLNDEELENAIVKHMYYLFSGRKKDDLEPEITNIHNWTAKVEFCIKRLKSFSNHSHQFIKYTIQGFYNKIKATRDYNPNYKLQSEIVLLKGSQFNSEALAEDYGLSKYSARPVRVFNIAEDNAAAARDCRVPSIINRFLEPHILEEYKKRKFH